LIPTTSEDVVIVILNIITTQFKHWSRKTSAQRLDKDCPWPDRNQITKIPATWCSNDTRRLNIPSISTLSKNERYLAKHCFAEPKTAWRSSSCVRRSSGSDVYLCPYRFLIKSFFRENVIKLLVLAIDGQKTEFVPLSYTLSGGKRGV